MHPSDGTLRGKARLSGDYTGPRKAASPVEHARAEHALPAERGRKWRKVRYVTLEEQPMKNLKMNATGLVPITFETKRIVTLEFLR